MQAEVEVLGQGLQAQLQRLDRLVGRGRPSARGRRAPDTSRPTSAPPPGPCPGSAGPRRGPRRSAPPRARPRGRPPGRPRAGPGASSIALRKSSPAPFSPSESRYAPAQVDPVVIRGRLDHRVDDLDRPRSFSSELRRGAASPAAGPPRSAPGRRARSPSRSAPRRWRIRPPARGSGPSGIRDGRRPPGVFSRIARWSRAFSHQRPSPRPAPPPAAARRRGPGTGSGRHRRSPAPPAAAATTSRCLSSASAYLSFTSTSSGTTARCSL